MTVVRPSLNDIENSFNNLFDSEKKLAHMVAEVVALKFEVMLLEAFVDDLKNINQILNDVLRTSKL